MSVICLVFAGFVPFVKAGDVSKIEGKRISAIEIRYNGAPSVEERRLRACIGLRKGNPYSSERADDDIRSIFESGFVDDVRISATLDGESVQITMHIDPRPMIGPPTYKVALTEAMLAKVTGWQRGKAISPAIVEAARRSLENHHRSRGCPNAVVSVLQSSKGTPPVFDISGGPL
jgi:outer membrane protein insertion porin family